MKNKTKLMYSTTLTHFALVWNMKKSDVFGGVSYFEYELHLGKISAITHQASFSIKPAD